MLSCPQCLQCWIFQKLQRTHITPFYISTAPHFSWGILLTERWWAGKMLQPAMQAGMQCECSTHPLKQKYPASFILWEEQMLALKVGLLYTNKSPKVVGGGLCFKKTGQHIFLMHSCVYKYNKEQLNNTHAISTHMQMMQSCGGISRKHVSGVAHGMEWGEGGINPRYWCTEAME